MLTVNLFFLVIALGILAIRVLGGGEDWYDVWNGGRHHVWFFNDGWFRGYGEFFRCVAFSTVVIVGLGLLWAITPGRTSPSYEESTPVKVASATPAKVGKKHTNKKKTTTKNHLSGQKLIAH